MGTTTRSSIFYPDTTDKYQLVTHLANMAQTMDDALDRQGNAYSGTDVERIAFTGKAKQGMLWANTDGDKQVYQFRNDRWWPEYEFVELTNPHAVFKPMTRSGLHVHSFGRFAVLSGVWSATNTFNWGPEQAWRNLGRIPLGYRPRMGQNLRDTMWGWFQGSSSKASRVEFFAEVGGVPGNGGDGVFQVLNMERYQDSESPYRAFITCPGITWPILQNV